MNRPILTMPRGWQDKGIEDPRNIDLAIVIGRFQPGPHAGHMKLFEKATSISKNVLILIGSAFIPRDARNPLTYDERAEMVLQAIAPMEGSFSVRPIVDDLYNNQIWLSNVQTEVDNKLNELGINPRQARVVLVGYRKEDTEYLDMFPQYIKVFIDSETDISGTAIRNAMFTHGVLLDGVPEATKKGISDWASKNVDIYTNLNAEHQFWEDYFKPYREMAEKYPNKPWLKKPWYVTGDATVINTGHILMEKRRSHPGKGLWALPGGHVEYDEFIDDAIFRELKEETSIGVSDDMLKLAYKGKHTFDAPRRSLRMRTVTHAGLFLLNFSKLPYVRGQDSEVEAVKWFTFSEFFNSREIIFEDHYSIGTFFINRVG